MLPKAPASDPIVVHKAHSLSPNQMTASFGGPLMIKAFPAAMRVIPNVMYEKFKLSKMRYLVHAPIITNTPDMIVGKTIPHQSIMKLAGKLSGIYKR